MFKFPEVTRQCESSLPVSSLSCHSRPGRLLCAARGPIPVSYPFLNTWTSCSYPLFLQNNSSQKSPRCGLRIQVFLSSHKTTSLKQKTERVGFPHHEAPEAWIQLLTPAQFLQNLPFSGCFEDSTYSFSINYIFLNILPHAVWHIQTPLFC